MNAGRALALLGGVACATVAGFRSTAKAATETAPTATVTVENPSDVNRPNETVEVAWSDLAGVLGKRVRADHVIVQNGRGDMLVGQPIYFHGQKQPADQFVFQADFAPHQTQTFIIKQGEPAPFDPKVYGRWVPERDDDFAWESDCIAYRIYGPKLEIVEPASSGIDVWPKRTQKLVVNDWYQAAQSINGAYYHYDHGQGCDCYKVGSGQGCGGTALWADGKRFTTGHGGWKTQTVLANGPIRLIFELTYGPIDVNGVGIRETKRVTLDAGHNLNHFESTFTADKPDADVQNISMLSGLVEHQDRPFEKQLHKEAGWISYWDAADNPGERPPTEDDPDGHTGTGVVMAAGQVTDAFEVDHQVELATHLTLNQPISFWAGAGWDRSRQFVDYAAWNNYLANWAKRAEAPLKVSVK